MKDIERQIFVQSTKFYYHIFYRETISSTFTEISRFPLKYKSKSRHDNSYELGCFGYRLIPLFQNLTEFDEANGRGALFRNEDKIAKRLSCGPRLLLVFLHSVSSVATLRTPFPRNLANYPDYQLDERLSRNWRDESRRHGTSHFTTASNFELRF